MVPFNIFTTITVSIALVTALPVKELVGSYTISKRASGTLNGILPTSSPAYLPSFPFHGIEPLDPIPTGPITLTNVFKTSDYPPVWTAPDLDHPEVKAAVESIDWNFVPTCNPSGPLDEYDIQNDEVCWWTTTQCTTPKVSYLPADTKFCPEVGHFGLTYDDGPLPPSSQDDEWAEPRLYDFLADHEQTATLFYVGSNVVTFPEAALRALQSGHTLCAHTWSHPHMTMLTNEEVVAQLYWSMRAIKEAAGVTTRCWRPPYGDVDDRVRAIAHQMGLSTIIWDSDSFDWGLPSAANDFAGQYGPDQIDEFFQQWITDRPNDANGHIVLEHETSNMTIVTTERWLPKLQKVFNVTTVHDCAPELPSPYWES